MRRMRRPTRRLRTCPRPAVRRTQTHQARVRTRIGAPAPYGWKISLPGVGLMPRQVSECSGLAFPGRGDLFRAFRLFTSFSLPAVAHDPFSFSTFDQNIGLISFLFFLCSVL